MKRKLYYTVYKYTQTIGDVEECTGNKKLTVYEIADNKPMHKFDVDCENSDNSKEKILDSDEFIDLAHNKEIDEVEYDKFELEEI